jgi:hypothetical protein
VLPVETVCGEPPEGVYSTVYPVMADEPGLAGAVHARETCALPAVAVRLVGAPGGTGEVGVTALLAAVKSPVPIAFLAATLNTWGTLLRPVTT